MKKTFQLLAFLFLIHVCSYSQEIAFFQKQQVILYEHANYTGQFKSLDPGQYVLSDFNDVASSIKVPAGMVAYIYEHAAPTQGYGISVDLLEDVPDLSVYNFNDKVSYITVFYATKDNLYQWARNKMTNGQFISGHWERKRARPEPPGPNNGAVVSPPIEGPMPTAPSAMAVNGATTTITSLGIQTTEGRMLWDRAMADQLGIIGNDYRGIEELGSACFERESNNIAIPDFLNFWYLQKQKNDHRSVVYFKRTLAGSVKRVHQVNISGTFEDYDINIDIRPDPHYMYLLNDAHAPEYTKLMKSQHYGSLGYSGESGCPASFDALEAEIAEDYKPSGNYKSKLVQLAENLVDKKVCVYGPWIWDEGHCCHPEIHPAEQVWWSEPKNNGKKYNLNVLCDASRRYWWRKQMDDGSKLNPWAEPPIKGLFAIAFEYTLPRVVAAAGYTTKKFEVANIDHYNVIEYPNTDQTYNLVFDGKNIVSFIPHNNAFKVSFEHVGIVPGARDKIRGFLVIETSVGTLEQIATSITVFTNGAAQIVKLPANSTPDKPWPVYEDKFFKKVAGHYYFTVTETNVGSGRLTDRIERARVIN